jgi:hypothetical protein
MTSDRPRRRFGLENGSCRGSSRACTGIKSPTSDPGRDPAEKAEDDRIALADEVLDFIARNCRSNVRELEAIVNCSPARH